MEQLEVVAANNPSEEATKRKRAYLSAALTLCPTRKHDKRVLDNAEGLTVFNAIVRAARVGGRCSIHEARVEAIKVMGKEFPHALNQLCECFRGLWPHWMDKECRDIVNKLYYNESSHLTKSQMAKLATMGYARTNKRAGGRRGSSAVPVQDRVCKHHPNNRAVARELCATCYQRLKTLKDAGIVNSNTSKAQIDKYLSIPIQAKGGPGSFVAKVAELRFEGRV